MSGTETAGDQREVVDPRIVDAWAEIAAAEHASIAAFARFTLELLAVGAPPQLLIASQDAGRDEVQHALKCFTITSRLAGKKLGPGPLDVGGLELSGDLASVTEAAVREGCFAETISAAIVRARSDGAHEAEMRVALLKIAEDEERHAELAWRFVAWALERGGPAIRDVVTRVVLEESATPRSYFQPALRGLPSEVVRAYGLLDEGTARDVCERTYREVIGPRARALLGGG